MSLAYSDHVQIGGAASSAEQSLLDGLRQRARLFELILADLLGSQTILYRNLVPSRLVLELLRRGGTTRSANPFLGAYTAQLVRCPDQLWRVAGDVLCDPSNHPAAQVLEAPALAGFLPVLCRALLHQSLLLPSLPSRWLADAGALQEIVANLPRWAIVDACRRTGRAITLSGLDPAQRHALQDRVDAEPWRYVARMLVNGRGRSITLSRTGAGMWTERRGCLTAE